MALTYRILPADEYEKLTPFCNRNDLPFPVPGSHIICVAEDEGEICARWDILLQPHLDNGCIDVAYRKRFVNLRRMWQLLLNSLPLGSYKVYSTSLLETGQRVLRRIGFNEYEAPLYVKQR